MSGFYDGQHIPPLDQMKPEQIGRRMPSPSVNVNPERVHPDVVGGAQDAARTFSRIADRLAALNGVTHQNSLQRQADAKELRMVAEAAVNLAKALA